MPHASSKLCIHEKRPLWVDFLLSTKYRNWPNFPDCELAPVSHIILNKSFSTFTYPIVFYWLLTLSGTYFGSWHYTACPHIRYVRSVSNGYGVQCLYIEPWLMTWKSRLNAYLFNRYGLYIYIVYWKCTIFTHCNILCYVYGPASWFYHFQSFISKTAFYWLNQHPDAGALWGNGSEMLNMKYWGKI